MSQYAICLESPSLTPSGWRHKAQVVCMRLKAERPANGGAAYRRLIEVAHKFDHVAEELVSAVLDAEQYI